MSRSQRQSELGVRGEYVGFGSYFVNFGHFDTFLIHIGPFL